MEGSRWRVFCAGLVVGILFAAMLLGGAAASVKRRGITISIEAAALEASIRTELQAALRRELPGMRERLEAEIPRLVGAEVARRLAAQQVEVGGVVVALPESLLQGMEQQVAEALRYSIDLSVQEADLAAMADQLGAEGARLAVTWLKEGLAGRTFSVRLAPWFAVPVTIETG